MESSAPEVGGAVRNLSTSWSQVVALAAAVDSALGKWLLDHYGIGLTEYRAALHLSRSSDHELRINDLAHKVGLNQSSTTRLVGRMESKEIAFRDTCPEDGRGVYAVITGHGIDVVREIHDPYEKKLTELLRNTAEQYPQLNLTGQGRAFEAIGHIIS